MKSIVKQFNKQAIEVFSDPLLEYGFEIEFKELKDCFCEIRFGNKEQYIKIEANIHPRDYPPCFNIILEEGGRDFTESDWNSVALWRLKNLIDQNDQGKEYKLPEINKLRRAIDDSLMDLIKYNGGFLNGNLLLFKKARAIQTKNKEPFKIYTPIGNGKLDMKYEPQSEELKRRYSKE
jgi:hypothetical protein